MTGTRMHGWALIALAATAGTSGCNGLPPALNLAGSDVTTARATLAQTLALEPGAVDQTPTPQGVERRLDIELLDRPAGGERARLSIDATNRGWIEAGKLVKACWMPNASADAAAPRQLDALATRIDLDGVKRCLAGHGLTGALVSEPVQVSDGPFDPETTAKVATPASRPAPSTSERAQSVLSVLRRQDAPATAKDTPASTASNRAEIESPAIENPVIENRATESSAPKSSMVILTKSPPPPAAELSTPAPLAPAPAPRPAEEELLGGMETTDAGPAIGAAAPPRAAKITPILTQALSAPDGAREAPPRPLKPMPKPARPLEPYKIGSHDDALHAEAARSAAGLPSLDELLSEEPVSVEQHGSVQLIRIAQ